VSFGSTVVRSSLTVVALSFRPAIVDTDGNLDWRMQLDLGFDMVDAQSTGSLAACLVEPILSLGGVLGLPPGYLAALRDKSTSAACC
jgi:2,2-dialkylglycine decarboxylase (pyruvate)